jgi:hypothetical protein
MFDISKKRNHFSRVIYPCLLFTHLYGGNQSLPLTEYLMPNDIFDKEADFIQLYLQGKINMHSSE